MAKKNEVAILIKAVDEASRILKSVESEVSKLDSSSSKAASGGLTSMDSKLRAATESSQKFLGILSGVGAGMLAAAGYSLKLASDAEQVNIAFEGMIGNQEKARDLLKTIADIAAESPFELRGIQDSTRKLLAYNFEVEKIPRMLTAVGDAVSGLGGGAAEIEQVVRALGQMQAKQKVSAEEMNQLAELGVNGWDMLAKKIGTSVPEAMKLAERGVITGSQGIEAIVEGLEAKFRGMMKEQARTLAGLFSTLRDEGTRSAAALGADLAEALDLRDKLAASIEWLKKIRETLEAEGLEELLGNYKTGFILLAGAITGAMVPALYAMATAAGVAIVAMAPFLIGGVVIGGIVALGVAMADAADDTDDLEAASRRAEAALESATEKTKPMKTALHELTQATDARGLMGAIENLANTLDTTGKTSLLNWAKNTIPALAAQGKLQDAIIASIQKFSELETAQNLVKINELNIERDEAGKAQVDAMMQASQAEQNLAQVRAANSEALEKLNLTDEQRQVLVEKQKAQENELVEILAKKRESINKTTATISSLNSAVAQLTPATNALTILLAKSQSGAYDTAAAIAELQAITGATLTPPTDTNTGNAGKGNSTTDTTTPTTEGIKKELTLLEQYQLETRRLADELSLLPAKIDLGKMKPGEAIDGLMQEIDSLEDQFVAALDRGNTAEALLLDERIGVYKAAFMLISKVVLESTEDWTSRLTTEVEGGTKNAGEALALLTPRLASLKQELSGATGVNADLLKQKIEFVEQAIKNIIAQGKEATKDPIEIRFEAKQVNVPKLPDMGLNVGLGMDSTVSDDYAQSVVEATNALLQNLEAKRGLVIGDAEYAKVLGQVQVQLQSTLEKTQNGSNAQTVLAQSLKKVNAELETTKTRLAELLNLQQQPIAKDALASLGLDDKNIQQVEDLIAKQKANAEAAREAAAAYDEFATSIANLNAQAAEANEDRANQAIADRGSLINVQGDDSDQSKKNAEARRDYTKAVLENLAAQHEFLSLSSTQVIQTLQDQVAGLEALISKSDKGGEAWLIYKQILKEVKGELLGLQSQTKEQIDFSGSISTGLAEIGAKNDRSKASAEAAIQAANAKDALTEATSRYLEITGQVPDSIQQEIDGLLELIGLYPEKTSELLDLIAALQEYKAVQEANKETTEALAKVQAAASGVLKFLNTDWSNGNEILTTYFDLTAQILEFIPGIGPALAGIARTVGSIWNSILGDMSNGMKEVEGYIDRAAGSSATLSEETVKALTKTKQVSRGGLLGLFGMTKTAVDEEASGLALGIAESLGSAFQEALLDPNISIEDSIRGITDKIKAAVITQMPEVQALIVEYTNALTEAMSDGFISAGEQANLDALTDKFTETLERMREQTLSEADRLAEAAAEIAQGLSGAFNSALASDDPAKAIHDYLMRLANEAITQMPGVQKMIQEASAVIAKALEDGVIDPAEAQAIADLEKQLTETIEHYQDELAKADLGKDKSLTDKPEEGDKDTSTSVNAGKLPPALQFAVSDSFAKVAERQMEAADKQVMAIDKLIRVLDSPFTEAKPTDTKTLVDYQDFLRPEANKQSQDIDKLLNGLREVYGNVEDFYQELRDTGIPIKPKPIIVEVRGPQTRDIRR